YKPRSRLRRKPNRLFSMPDNNIRSMKQKPFTPPATPPTELTTYIGTPPGDGALISLQSLLSGHSRRKMLPDIADIEFSIRFKCVKILHSMSLHSITSSAEV